MKRIALLGYGTVGSGVYEVVAKNIDSVKDKFKVDISIEDILVRNVEKYKDLIHLDKFKTDFDSILESEPDIVVEVMGGLHPAYDYIKKCIENGIHVVTANKDLIAEYGQELQNLAAQKDVALLFEASVGGGIPVLKPLQECLGGNSIDSITAVINGTTNFILSKMYNENMSYEDALKIAQDVGFAEADPTSDVQGFDAVRKLAILSSLAYGQEFKWSDMPTVGITDIDSDDIECVKTMDSKIKLLAYSEYINNELYAAVRPVVVSNSDPIALIDNEFNAVILTGDSVGEVMFVGKGAGKLPTASAVFGDILDIIQNKKEKSYIELRKDATIHKLWPKASKWVIRLVGQDKNTMIRQLLDQFAGSELRIQTSENDHQIHAVVHSDNESMLLAKLSDLEQADNIDHVKYFLVYR
ncbi:homoserine dehydrogenase [Fusibacter sp. JL216-2]|uniref:homoserine dehydrogenase n=1 Tax=Fusibacter sp. JL216-2 TaxID=3071453 RepID=UPI003D3589D7